MMKDDFYYLFSGEEISYIIKLLIFWFILNADLKKLFMILGYKYLELREKMRRAIPGAAIKVISELNHDKIESI